MLEQWQVIHTIIQKIQLNLNIIGVYNNVSGAPATPWGSTNTAVGGQAHLNVPQFVQNTFGPQWQEAATGSSAQYPTGAPLAPIAPTTGVSGV
jgi:hypothetical protein